MKKLDDFSLLTNYPAKLDRVAGASRFYGIPAPTERVLKISGFHHYDRALKCTYLCKNRFEDKGAFVRRLKQPFFSIEYIYYGEMYVHSNNVAYIAEAGDLCLLHSGGDHEFLINSSHECLKVGMIFGGNLLEMLLESLGLKKVNILPFLDNKRFDLLVEKLKNAMQSPVCSTLYDTISGIVFEFLQTIATAGEVSQSKIPLEIVAIIEELKRNIAQKISIKTIAAKHGMTVQTLNNKFKIFLGITAYKYLIQLRMLNALNYLREKNYP